jgi:hypothetical protein
MSLSAKTDAAFDNEPVSTSTSGGGVSATTTTSTVAAPSKTTNANVPTSKSKSKSTNAKETDICDDWEQLDQKQIEKSLQSIKLVNNVHDDEEKKFKNGATNKNVNLNVPVFSNVQLPQQPIKILQRPASSKTLNELTNQSQNPNNQSQPIKTFEQREQEYAQARLRILGSAHPEEETSSSSSNTPQANTANNTTNNKTSNQSQMSHQQQQQSSKAFNNTNINLIRDPIVPDGTKGFQSRTTNVNSNSSQNYPRLNK